MKYVKPMVLFEELLSSKSGRLMGLDVGEKYIGLAVSDKTNKVAQPFSNVLLRTKSNISAMADDFQQLVKVFSLVGFVVGYPFDKYKKCPDAVQVMVLMEDLCKTKRLEGIKYTYWDESFTSKSVAQLTKSIEMGQLEYKTMSDKFAAIGILQAYLDHMIRASKIHKGEK